MPSGKCREMFGVGKLIILQPGCKDNQARITSDHHIQEKALTRRLLARPQSASLQTADWLQMEGGQ